MGCYNEVCSFSGLPIRDGDDVVALLIATEPKRPTFSHIMHVEDQGIQFGPPIFGKYNDYGSLMDIKENKVFDEFIQTISFKSDLVTSLNIKDFLDTIVREDISINYHNQRDIYIKAVFVHKYIYDQMLLVASAEPSWESGLNMKEYLKKEFLEASERVCNKVFINIFEKTIDEEMHFSLSGYLNMGPSILDFTGKKYYETKDETYLSIAIDRLLLVQSLGWLKMTYFGTKGISSQCEKYTAIIMFHESIQKMLNDLTPEDIEGFE